MKSKNGTPTFAQKRTSISGRGSAKGGTARCAGCRPSSGKVSTLPHCIRTMFGTQPGGRACDFRRSPPPGDGFDLPHCIRTMFGTQPGGRACDFRSSPPPRGGCGRPCGRMKRFSDRSLRRRPAISGAALRQGTAAGGRAGARNGSRTEACGDGPAISGAALRQGAAAGCRAGARNGSRTEACGEAPSYESQRSPTATEERRAARPCKPAVRRRGGAANGTPLRTAFYIKDSLFGDRPFPPFGTGLRKTCISERGMRAFARRSSVPPMAAPSKRLPPTGTSSGAISDRRPLQKKAEPPFFRTKAPPKESGRGSLRAATIWPPSSCPDASSGRKQRALRRRSSRPYRCRHPESARK